MQNLPAKAVVKGTRKIVPRGPIVRLTAQTTQSSTAASNQSGSVLGREDWNAGRDLTAEEKRCGLLLRLCEVKERKEESGAGSPSERQNPLEAVIKAQSSDYQVNEIDLRGAAAFLEKSPKGRWRKISRQKTHLVENTSSPFSDMEKSYNPLVLNYGEYVRRIGKLPKDSPILQFVMYRDCHSLSGVLNRFRYEIGVDQDAVFLRSASLPGASQPVSTLPMSALPTVGPPGGSFGCFTQFGCCVGVTREQLAHVSRHYNLHPLLMDPRGYHSLTELPSLSASPWGYLYRIMLRCVAGDTDAHVLAALRRISQDGFINYFGLEKFGLADTSLFEIAGLASQGDFAGAVGGYFQSLAESHPLHYSHYMAYVNAEESTAGALAHDWAAACATAKVSRYVLKAVQCLAAYHTRLDQHEVDKGTAAKELFEELNLRAAAEDSAAEFVWNAMATQRVLTGGASRVLVGDIVRASSTANHGATAGTDSYRLVASEEEAQQYAITDVVLPVPRARRCRSDASTGSWCGFPGFEDRLYREFAERHKFSFLTSPEKGSNALPDTHAELRHLVVKPLRLQASVMADPSSCAALKTDLFLRQERRATESLDLDYEARVREPSPYNVSERFSERMSAIRRHRDGTRSVALSFLLPAGSSPMVALREAFALKYPNFTDLYFTS